jgi:hypothetical protein
MMLLRRRSPPPALRATSPVEGEERAKLGSLPPLDGEGAGRSPVGGVNLGAGFNVKGTA